MKLNEAQREYLIKAKEKAESTLEYKPTMGLMYLHNRVNMCKLLLKLDSLNEA